MPTIAIDVSDSDYLRLQALQEDAGAAAFSKGVRLRAGRTPSQMARTSAHLRTADKSQANDQWYCVITIKDKESMDA